MIDEKKLIKDILQHEDALKDANYVYKNGYETRGKEIIDIIERQPTVEAVPKSYAEQIRWERDVAVGQLNEIGCQFGQKMDEVKKKLEAVPVVHCKDCRHWHKDTGWCKHHSHFIDSKGKARHPWGSSNWKMFNENDFCSDGERVKDECVCKKERH